MMSQPPTYDAVLQLTRKHLLSGKFLNRSLNQAGLKEDCKVVIGETGHLEIQVHEIAEDAFRQWLRRAQQAGVILHHGLRSISAESGIYHYQVEGINHNKLWDFVAVRPSHIDLLLWKKVPLQIRIRWDAFEKEMQSYICDIYDELIAFDPIKELAEKDKICFIRHEPIQVPVRLSKEEKGKVYCLLTLLKIQPDRDSGYRDAPLTREKFLLSELKPITATSLASCETAKPNTVFGY